MGILILFAWRVATFPIAFIYSLFFDRPPAGMRGYSLCLLIGHSDVGRMEQNDQTWFDRNEGFFFGVCGRCLKERYYSA